MNSKTTIKIVIPFAFYFLFSCLSTFAQSISFGSTGLIGENIVNPTSLEFGPDDRLYVSQQDGTIWAFTIERDASTPGQGIYTITNTEIISIVKNEVANHNDFGIINTIQQRQLTGIMTDGTASNPILYVTSSDYLNGGPSGDTNLDTNSSVLSKLEWNGSAWTKIDLIRGFPRCEENHAISGIDKFEKNGNTYLLINMGGHTNKGAPSNNFAGTPEYFFSGTIVIVNLTQLESMTVYTDPRTNSDYVYDLPTLNDPERADIDNTDAEFPYPSGHPMYNYTIDVNDPFGGNNGLNQAIPEAGGPVEVFSFGFRNAYDILVTQGNKVFTSDNGPNNGWGGLPYIYSNADDTLLGTESSMNYDPALHYIKNEFNESGSNLVGDPFHYIGTINDPNDTYYGGHPLPINAFPSRAKINVYEDLAGTWTLTSSYNLSELLTGVSGYFKSSFSMADFPDNPKLGEYLLDEPTTSTKVNIIDVVSSSTNGIAEYTATAPFGGIMEGNILTASFSGAINRYALNEAGDAYLLKEEVFNGFGNTPLDVTTQGDSDIFPGTIWAATYGSNGITVFEPAENIDCIYPNEPEYVANEDYDMDGYSNQDEIDNLTDHCSQGSKPDDNDGDFISDLNDDDDDNDAILDVDDVFAIDPNNGLSTNLPVNYPFWNNDPGTGFFGLGFTGLMLDPTVPKTDYLTQFNEENLSFGGAAGKATVDVVSSGDASGALNNQDNAFQFGINVDSNSNPFTVHSRIESPFFNINGNATNPVNNQSYGISIGNGDQDNYLKVVLMNGTVGNGGIQVVLEENGVINPTNDNIVDITNILDATSIDFYISVNPANNTAQPFYSLDNGITQTTLGSEITLPLNFLDPNDTKGLAISLISTSRNATDFTATWDFIEVSENQNGVISFTPNSLDFGYTPSNNNQRSKLVTLTNEGGPGDQPVTISGITISGTNASLFSSPITFPFDLAPGNSIEFPINFTSDQTLGVKNASMNLNHSGTNSPASLPLTGELTDTYVPIVRVNAGGAIIAATDGGPDWELNDVTGNYTGNSYTVDSGSTYSTGSIDYNNKHLSIPTYIDQSTYESLYISERYNELTFTFPIPNGDYIVNLYVGNTYSGTSQPNERVFNINVEDVLVSENLDLSENYGHEVGAMIQINTSVTDGNLDIELIQNIENPLINGIEILGVQYPLISINQIPNQDNFTGDIADLSVVAFGGNPNLNLNYAISGQPTGVDIEPTNGLIFGEIDENAISGGQNNDGVHNVTVTISKYGSSNSVENFTWTVIDQVLNTEKLVLTEDSILIYPNPTRKYIHILTALDVKSFDLYDILGNRVLISEETNQINIESLSSGIYLLNINTNLGKIIKKVIIE